MADAEKKIALFGSRLFEENYMRFIQKIQEKCKEKKYRLIVFSLDTDIEENTKNILAEIEVTKLTKYISVEAGIILAESIKNETVLDHIAKIFQEKEIPCFCIDRQIKGCICLFHAEETGFEPMVRHVIKEHGAKRINMLAGFKGHPYSQMRIKQYKKVLEENGIQYEEERVGYGDFWDRPAKREMKRFLASKLPMPDAIVCANDVMAIVACNMLHEAGYRVPEDVIVTGYDGINAGKIYSPAISTCVPNEEGAASFIMEEIERFQESGVVVPGSYQIDYQIELNQSCGCQKKEQGDHNDVIGKLDADLGDCGWHALAMSQLISSAVPLHTVSEITKILPDTEYMWCEHLRYACVKDKMSYGQEDRAFDQMLTIMNGNHEQFSNVQNTFYINDWYEEIRNALEECSVLLIRMLNVHSKIFGYTVEAMEQIDTRTVQRCNEFAMFLSNSINMVLQNQQMNELKENLMRANSELEVLSKKDAMTGIYNRRGFFARLNELLQTSNKKYLVWFSIDMNHLKYINDTFGHAEGDFAIRALARAVEKLCTKEGICARFGGDEFDCAIFTDDQDQFDEKTAKKELQEYLDQTEGIQHKEYHITASLGMVVKKITGLQLEKTINEADSLMYLDKKEHRRH